MSELDLLAQRFEQDRAHLRRVAQRILGSADEAEDAVQETWVRLSRSDTTEVGNLTGWLTTVVSRVCLDMLRSRQARREHPADLPTDLVEAGPGPEQRAEQYDAIGPALLLVLDTLGPGERLAFVLHDLFAVPFPEIADILGTTPAAARQLASRARRRVQGGGAADEGGARSGGAAGKGGGRDAEAVSRRRAVVDAFLAAAQGGDFTRLLTLLHPDVVLRADPAAVEMGANALLNGSRAVAERFQGARAARMALIDGEPGLVWAAGGVLRVVFVFTVEDGRVTGIEQVADPAAIAAMEVTYLRRGGGGDEAAR